MMILSDNDDDYDDLLMMGSSAVSQLATRRSICPTRPLPKTQCKSTQDEATLFDSNQNEISKQCANTPRIENITITAHLTIGKSLQLCKRSTPNYQNHSQEDHPDHCQKKAPLLCRMIEIIYKIKYCPRCTRPASKDRPGHLQKQAPFFCRMLSTKDEPDHFLQGKHRSLCKRTSTKDEH